ncbi:hypothetical protein KFE25_007845 [Diacronema lutheri]|uniref:Nucleolar protein 6 n=1 Tax=Diacronema lutheri TaxID=2081491 RepID=A0A8J6CBY9_DIALT|nr:hypothetical protein KFE25_007845 [Diacronema lutheri]
MAPSRKRARGPDLSRAAVVADEGPGENGEARADPELLSSGLPRVSLKLPKGTLPAAPKVRLPTADEQLQMRAADSSEELAHANLLHMQLEALLDEIAVEYAAPGARALDEWLRALRGALLALPPSEPLVDGDALPLVAGVEPLEWQPPARVVLTGSYLLRTQLLPALNVDLAVELPRGCLREKDHLDGRFADRRQLWLHHLAVLLSHPNAAEAWEAPASGAPDPAAARGAIRAVARLCARVDVLAWGGDGGWPVLSVAPASVDAARALGGAPLAVRLIPFIALDALPLSRLRPSRCCVRPPAGAGAGAGEGEGAARGAPTARYNAQILADAAHVPALEAMHAVFSRDARGSLRDGVLLVKAWARQRGFCAPAAGVAEPASGLTPFACAALVAALAQRRVVTSSMSGAQAFRVVLHWLAGEAVPPLVLRPPAGTPAPADADVTSLLAEHVASGAHALIVLEPRSGANLTSGMSAGALADVRHEARIGMRLLSAALPLRTRLNPASAAAGAAAAASGGGGGGSAAGAAGVTADGRADGGGAEGALSSERSIAIFEALFVKRVEPALKWDVQLRVTLPRAESARRANTLASDAAAAHRAPGTAGLDEHAARLLDAEHVLRRALGDRVRLVRVGSAALGPCAPARARSPPRELRALLLLAPDPLTVARQVDRGPADAEEAVAYGDAAAADAARAAVADWLGFWGGASELRRFKDGQVVHAVVWPPERADGVYERSGVLCRIAQYALSRHLPGARHGAPPVHVHWPLGALLAPLALAGADGGRGALHGAARAADKLAGAIRRLRDLPLAVLDVRPTSSALRYAAEPPPQPLGAGVAPPVGAKPLCIVVTLEGSGKWPTDADAIDALRAALHVRLAEKLQQASGLPGVFEPGGPPDSVSASADHVDMLLDGYALRVTVTHDEHLRAARAAADAARRNGAAEADGADADARAAADARVERVARACVALPALAAALRQVALAQPAFAPCARLAKRWCARQLLSPHVGDELLEALAAHVVVGANSPSAPTGGDSDSSSAYEPPFSATTAFLRLLALLARHAWDQGPLDVPLRTELPASSLSGALELAAAAAPTARMSAPAGAPQHPLLRVSLRGLDAAASRLDVGALCCAQAPAIAQLAETAAYDGVDGGRPCRVVARRLSRLAEATLAELCAQLLSDAPAEEDTPPSGAAHGEAAARLLDGACERAVSAALTPALREYDVLLALSKQALRELSANNGRGLSGFKNLDALSAAPDWPSRLGVDRVGALVRELESTYGHLAIFFLDRLEGKAIALRWKPTAFVPVKFRVGAARSMIALPGASRAEPVLMVPNVLELLQDMLDLGEGLLTVAEPVR